MPVSDDATYQQVALEDPEGRWELVCGRLRSKPPVTTEHASVISALYLDLARQLDRNEYLIRSNTSRTHVSSGS